MAYEALRHSLLQSGTDMPDSVLMGADANSTGYANDQYDAATAWLKLQKDMELRRRAHSIRGMRKGQQSANSDRKYQMLGALLGAGGQIAGGSMGGESAQYQPEPWMYDRSNFMG